MCVAVGSVLLSSAGCGGASSSKPAGPAPVAAGSSSPSTAAPARALTVDQLRAALLAAAEVPDTKLNPQQETSDLTTDQDVLATGSSASCQKLTDATELYATPYGTVSEVGRDLLGATDADIRYDLTLAVLPEDKAKQLMADIAAGLAGCHGTYFLADESAGKMSDAVKQIQVGPLGDSSIAYIIDLDIVGFGGGRDYVEFVRVGSVIVEVTDYPTDNGHPISAAKLQAQLEIVAKAQVAKLQASVQNS